MKARASCATVEQFSTMVEVKPVRRSNHDLDRANLARAGDVFSAVIDAVGVFTRLRWKEDVFMMCSSSAQGNSVCMASVQPVSLEGRISLSIVCALSLPIGLYFIWMTWIGFEAYYTIRAGSPVNAKIESISKYKNTYEGKISFSFEKKRSYIRMLRS